MIALDYQTDGGGWWRRDTISRSDSERLARLGIPVILFGRMLEAPGVDCIVADNIEGAREGPPESSPVPGAGRVVVVRRERDTFSDDERVEAGCAPRCREGPKSRP